MSIFNQHRSKLIFFFFALKRKTTVVFFFLLYFYQTHFSCKLCLHLRQVIFLIFKSEIIFSCSSLCSFKEIYQALHALNTQLAFFSFFPCYPSRWVVFKHSNNHFKCSEHTQVKLLYWGQRYIIFSHVWLQMKWFENNLKVLALQFTAEWQSLMNDNLLGKKDAVETNILINQKQQQDNNKDGLFLNSFRYRIMEKDKKPTFL